MKTKERIIYQAIASYNAKGVANVTSRDLAKELGMSHGNLEYHFPNKVALLLAIYERMRTEISADYEIKETQEPFDAFNTLLIHLEAFQEKYKFFNLDFLEISRNAQEIGALLNETYKLRQGQLATFFEKFRQAGYIKEEVTTANYSLILHSVMVLIMFWKVQQSVLPAGAQLGETRLTKHVWALLHPIMTSKGEVVYNYLNIHTHA